MNNYSFNKFLRLNFLIVAFGFSFISFGQGTKSKTPPSKTKAQPKPQTELQTPTQLESDLDYFRNLQKEVSHFKFLSLDYLNMRSQKVRQKIVESRGNAYFSKPTKFRWVKKNSEIIYDGKNFFQYTPTEKAAVSFSFKDEEGRQINKIMGLVLSFETLLDSYEFLKLDKTKNMITVELKPKDSNDPTKWIRLGIDAQKKVLANIHIQMDDYYSKYEFSNQKFEQIDENKFSLPKGTNISKL